MGQRAKSQRRRCVWSGLAAAAAAAVALVSPGNAALGTTVRVVSYNVDCSDLTNNTDPKANANLPDVATVLQAIGVHQIGGNAQRFDVLGAQELLDTNNNTITSASLPALVNDLNAVYGAGAYAFDSTPDPTAGGVQFDGPSGLIYNTQTIQVVAAKALGYSGTGAGSIPRAPMRYLLHPIGYSTSANFYMYVSHYKSTAASGSVRLQEATEIRADADALGPNVPILYTGDHNIFQDSAEPSYQKLLSTGNGQAHDAMNPTQDFVADAAHVNILTVGPTAVQFRDDLQLTSGTVWNQSGTYTQNSLRLANGGNGAAIVFGNGSSPTVPAGGTGQPFQGSINYAGNHTLDDLPNTSAVLTALTKASDHLPVVADYTLAGLTALPQTRYYVGPASGTWNTSSNWSTSDSGPGGASVPATGDTVIVDPSAGAAVSFDANYISPGVSELRLNGTGGSTATVNQTANALVVSGNVLLGQAAGQKGSYSLSGGALTAGAIFVGSSSGGAGTFTLSGSGTLNVTGSLTNYGTVTLGATQNWSAGASFNNAAGTATFNTDAGSAAAATLTVNVTGGSVTFAAGQHLAGLNLSASGQALLTPAASAASPRVLNVASLSIIGSAKLDLSNDEMTATATADSIRTKLIGGAIFSSSSDATHTLGYNDIGGGQTEVRYTLLGDTDLNGSVDVGDLGALASNYGISTDRTWSQGDFNYDDKADVADLGALATNYGVSLGAGSIDGASVAGPIAAAAAVPEPGGMWALLSSAAILCQVRLRNRDMKRCSCPLSRSTGRGGKRAQK
ncbi:MAG TPA: hypothetical protein VLI90_08835 [Tepidisphaeraceae bacterium]|nr:hypothetical protein [Tepidisphaeraceae bacterium]